MTYVADLTTTGRVSHVGYLARGHAFPKGATSEELFDRLVVLVECPLAECFGYHTCDIRWCWQRRPKFRYKGRDLFLGNIDIFVPGDEVVYSAPSLILHYIRRHKYLPPTCFVEAVLTCPKPLSPEYLAAIKRIAPETGHGPRETSPDHC
jgi:hypothetical protein